ncbi:hypothetical protein J2S13_000290 [Oikeobacillus pervagus]|uniref:tRNA methyltransferase n=1 Tax=Oikeobacillus pervagus TaxID=1325931 RepID=A0AAJ1SZ02_9BACI|nr:DUF2624 domain-containing protein [Oikeobacillus pervagus]MDQ0213896.1 hypothetical protein [Oikeobacillus pervagus]
MKFIHSFVNNKINSISSDDLLKYSKAFNISLTTDQAEKICDHLSRSKINIFDDSERTQLVKDVAKIAGPKTAREINRLFVLFTK